ncbi:MAG: divalent metal cation transporter [Planctomycetaceae bacterium]|nr:divalent metal cation transporter [Planctomycetaceae bacterium]
MDNPAAADPTPDSQVAPPPQVEADRELIRSSREQGTLSLFGAFVKLSGPGWLQSAITLGGGSLAGSLYLGVLAGYGLMWLQPLAMIMGVIMLSAIGYVTLSTGERPFKAINEHVNPVLGWGWAIATLMANLVWCMPQFALGKAAITQNLFPEVFAGMPAFQQNLICSAVLLFVAGTVIWFYDSGSWGIKLFEIILKLMVAAVVISFFGVVLKMTSEGALDWNAIFQGFIPNFRLLGEPADTLKPILQTTGEFAQFWTDLVVRDQQNVMITAAATAVGINMTFLLPYSMLAKGWDKDFRGLAIFDLSTGLFIPFVLATSCVVLSAASQFHAQPQAGLFELYQEGMEGPTPSPTMVKNYNGLLDSRLKQEWGPDSDRTPTDEDRAALPEADRRVAAMLVKRDADNLANALQNIAGKGFAQKVFGLGVLGMAISTIVILMLINGFTVCEMLGRPDDSQVRRMGAFLPGITGFLGPFFWGQAAVYLAVPTSMFGMVLLPIAYWTFFLMMNSKSLMGSYMPVGGKRLLWNVLMILAAGLATFGSYWSIRNSANPFVGYSLLFGFVVLASLVGLLRQLKR